MQNSAEISVFGYVYGEPKFPSSNHPNFVTFSLSVTTKRKDKATAEEIKTVAWYECRTSVDWMSTVIQKYVKQGVALYVRGEPKCEAYMGKENVPQCKIKIDIKDLKLLSYPKEETKEGAIESSPTITAKPEVFNEILDDEIPF